MLFRSLKRAVVQNQLTLLRLRNTSHAFNGNLVILDTDEHSLNMRWESNEFTATLFADLRDYKFKVTHKGKSGDEEVYSF